MTALREGGQRTGSLARWLGVLTLLVVVAISYIDRVNVSVLITDSDFTQHFGIEGNRAVQGALMTLFLVGYGIAAMLITPWYEAVFGVRRGLIVSLLCWALFTLVSPYAGGAVLLLTLRFLLGASEGPLFSLKTMYVKDQFAEGTWGKPNAVSSMGVSIGTAVGIPVITFAVVQFGWHGSFLLLAALNLVVGLPLVAAFIRVSRRRTGVRQPAVQRFTAALRTPKLGWILLIEVATLGYLWGSTSWLPSYLLQARHFSLAQMSALSALPFVVSLASGFLGGYVIDRVSPRRVPIVLVIGSVGTALCATTVMFAESRWLAAAMLILANGFWGLQGPAIPTLVQQYAPPGTVGSAYGVINGIGNLVSALLPMLMGVAIALGGNQGFAAGYGLLAATQVLTLLGAVALLRGRGPHTSAEHPPADQPAVLKPQPGQTA
ncbi:MFS transporter [Saccharopolyspora sp. WRP15-2]|uniref:MFS transporter n=1 Tax=Saccharopolyspora oryzae TaxID=2997343 RepID=A0ABT4VAR3_9PSEU|nr:MFS transporter [Saccharopolyspora oryzae]MDA3631047.1 MFS transporter [Saccharopolyspora oryzae]